MRNNTTSTDGKKHLVQFYDWTSGCVTQVPQTEINFNVSSSFMPRSVSARLVGHGDFPQRCPNRATVSRLHNYYNPSVRLLEKSPQRICAWQDNCSLTLGEQRILEARQNLTTDHLSPSYRYSDQFRLQRSIGRTAKSASNVPPSISRNHSESSDRENAVLDCNRNCRCNIALSSFSRSGLSSLTRPQSGPNLNYTGGICLPCTHRYADSEIQLAAKVNIRERMQDLTFKEYNTVTKIQQKRRGLRFNSGCRPSSPERVGINLPVVTGAGYGNTVVKDMLDGRAQMDVFLPHA